MRSRRTPIAQLQWVRSWGVQTFKSAMEMPELTPLGGGIATAKSRATPYPLSSSIRRAIMILGMQEYKEIKRQEKLKRRSIALLLPSFCR